MGFLRNLSLKYKILMPGAIGVISFAAYLIVNFVASQHNARMLAEVQDARLPILELANQTINRLDELKQGLVFAVSTGEQSLVDEGGKIGERISQNIKELSSLDHGHPDKVAAIQQAYSDYINLAVPLTRAMITGTAGMGTAQASVKRMRENLKSLEGLLADYRAQSRGEFVGAVQQVNDRNRETMALGLLIGGLTMTLLLGMAWWVAKVITTEVKSVADSLKQIASGDADLTKQLHCKGRDEVGELVHWFNTFVAHLRTIIREVASSTAHLAAAAEEMTSIVAQAKEGAGHQQRETEQLAAAVHEMTMTIGGMAQSAAKASEAAQAADQEAVSGKAVVKDTITTIDALVGEVEKTAGAIQKLEQESNNIGKVLDVIRDIADQTNLLALNAAIEAARAGEQGRGFAVVADEVRVLAQRSSQSTNEIRGIIERLQGEARDAVQVMESSRGKAQESVSRAASAGAALQSITSDVSGIAAMNTEIAVTADQQNSVAEEINKNIININRIAQETAEGASQTTGASTELAKLAIGLEGLVGQFKV